MVFPGQKKGVTRLTASYDDGLKSTNPWLILTSGLSQLSTALAALSSLREDFRGAQVLSILWLINEAMCRALNEVCDLFGVRYSGNFPGGLAGPGDYHEPAPAASTDDDLKRQVSLSLLAQRPELGAFVGRRVVIPARPDVPQDVLLLSALRPSVVLLIADGIQNDAIVRRDSGPRWRGYDATLRRLPTDAAVWCPEYLEQDCQYIGVPRVIPPEDYEATLNRMLASPLGQRLAGLATPGGQPVKSIVLSQHLNVSGLCSLQDELAYYQDIVAELRQRGQTPILFKSHPRDQMEKLEAVRRGCSDLDITITDEDAACIPIECLDPLFANKSVEVVGTTSSAMLGTVAWGEHVRPCIVDADYLPADLRTRIVRFAVRHGLPIRRETRFADDSVEIGAALYRKDELETKLATLSASHAELSRECADLQERLAGERAAHSRELQEKLAAEQAAHSRELQERLASERAAHSRELAAIAAESARSDWQRRAWRVAAAALNRPMVVWGAGQGGRTVLEWLQGLGASIEMIVDSNPAKIGHAINGTRVESPLALHRIAESGTKPFVAVASVYTAEIEAFLTQRLQFTQKDYELLSELGQRALPG
jgi:hypothetical protein